MNILKALLVSEIWEGERAYLEEHYGPSKEQQMRDKSPALQEAWETYQDAQQKYKILYKLLKNTEKFR